MTEDLVILGCGGFGREVAVLVRDINATSVGSHSWNMLGFLDDSPSNLDLTRVERIGSQVLGKIEKAGASLRGSRYVIGVGNGSVRRDLAARADAAGLVASTLIHPSARVGTDVTIGDGSLICAGVTLTTNIAVGRHVHLNLHTTVGHDTTIEDFATINPLVAISGNCHIGARSNLGTHSAVLPGIRIGEDATTGGGAFVVKDVAASTVVKGVPAR